MANIKLEFTARQSFDFRNSVTVVLTMDENGKHYSASFFNDFLIRMIAEEQTEAPAEQLTLSENILTAFTEEAVTEIFSKDEIPFGAVLDGTEYNISITIGEKTKEYYANDANVLTFPLLSLLADWYNKQLDS